MSSCWEGATSTRPVRKITTGRRLPSWPASPRSCCLETPARTRACLEGEPTGFVPPYQPQRTARGHSRDARGHRHVLRHGPGSTA